MLFVKSKYRDYKFYHFKYLCLSSSIVTFLPFCCIASSIIAK
ncbi:hypothetical protein CAPGI0001_1525 [Capnocytophaga gingivalis ATCC 33624]|nr:hypothetical protein CAPGI0001_1525 [Capnocytophaga gingivalis ATCC 33624]